MIRKKQTAEQRKQELARLHARVAELEAELAGVRRADARISQFVKPRQAVVHNTGGASGLPRERFRQVLDSADDVIWCTDAEGRFTYVSRAVRSSLGYEPDELIGKAFDIVLTETATAEARAFLSAYLRGELGTPPLRLELVHRRKDGTEFCGEIITHPILDDQGRLVEIQGITRDVSERKRAEEVLRESEAMLRGILRAVPLGVGVTRNRVMLWSNDQMSAMIGRSKDEFQGLSSRILYESDAEFDRVGEALAKGMNETGAGCIETRLVRKDGSSFEALILAARVNPSDPSSVVIVVVSDITEQTRAADTLRESEERYRSLFENAPVAMWEEDYSGVYRRLQEFRDAGITDLRAYFNDHPEVVWELLARVKILAANNAAVRLHGASSEGELRSKLHSVFAPETYPALREGIIAIAGGSSSFETETIVHTLHGAKQDLFVRWAVVPSSQGCGPRVYLSLMDITKRKRAEEEREKLEAQLRQAQKMEAVGQLAGGVAHDFNNLLQVISGYGELLAGELRPGTRGHLEIKEMMKAAERAGALVRQLLAFSRRESIRPRNVELNDLIRDLLKMLRRVIGEHIDLRLDLREGAPAIWADPGQIEQVLMNLCVNARDAMPGGGRLAVETRPVELTEDFMAAYPEACPGRYVLLRVSDTGHGMEPDVLDRMYEPFFTTKSVGKGTGLGLATVYGIVKQHGGIITCSSEPGKGASFSVYLPAAAGAAEEFGSENAPLEIPCGTETILFAEDEPLVRNLGRQILTSGGYRVLAAKDGHEALKLYDAHAEEIALVVLDVVMPGFNGKAVADRIKSHNPHIPILFSSGYDFSMLEGVLSSGEVANVIRKPYTQREFLRRIRELLDEAKRNQSEYNAG